MTIKDLSKYKKIKEEIEQIEKSINELEETIIGSSKILEVPTIKNNTNSNPTERISIKLSILKSKLVEKREKLLDEAFKIENFIESVEDSDIRIIIRKRFLECKTWQQVGNEIITDRSTPYYRLKNYLDTEKEVIK